MDIRPVRTQADLRRFVDLPYRLYRHDPIWVPPLRSEQWAQFDPRRNPMLDHCEHALFLLEDGGQVVGRISAFVDRLALEHWRQPIGLFGSYECVEDDQAAQLLLGAAREWLRQHHMAAMRGPWSFASQEWGLVVDGYTPPPVLLAPYNPPYYNRHLEAFGLEKAKDLLVYYADAAEGYRIPERYLTLTDRVQQRYGVTVRTADMAHLADEVAAIVAMANRAIADNWGFYPVTEAEGRALARDLRQVLDPRGALIAEGPDGRPIGFCLALPDVNLLLRGLNGRLFPLGWLKLLWGLPRLRQYRLWALGVVPEYQGKAVDALLYRRTYENLAPRRVRVEINYVLEDNVRMNNALRNLGVKYLRRYRVYEMAI
ncbi:MAG: N-acetyltransferase [Anaerolineae bacterium]|nr:N-acetyltransferase [Anaerolineae bacterium]